MKHHQVKLHLKEEAQPRFHRARPVPSAIRDEVAKELDGLEGTCMESWRECMGSPLSSGKRMGI